MSVLHDICQTKRLHIAARKKKSPLESLLETIQSLPAPRGFAAALRRHAGPAIIAEVKKASPSKGIIRADFNPVEIAQIYAANGAACLSVLTDTPYFQGSDEDFAAVRAAVSLPMIRKDFMLDPYQIYESRALGADCVLLIMAALDDAQAAILYQTARDLALDVLVEVHDAAELERALALGPAMIGINNRNLKTLEVSLETSHALSKSIPAGVLRVAESGIRNAADIQALAASGFEAFLIGESLMREKNIGEALKNLRLTQIVN